MHSYYDAVLGFPFVTGLTEKLYKISYALSVGGPKCWRYPFYKEKSPIKLTGLFWMTYFVISIAFISGTDIFQPACDV